MHRWKSLLGMLMLVLMIWAGTSAHAAERTDAVAVTAEIGHYEGDGDQVPADQHEGVAHHHAPCADQHVGALGTEPSAYAVSGARSALLPERQSNAPGREPEADLRPPIA
jgi:hypothetical protein